MCHIKYFQKGFSRWVTGVGFKDLVQRFSRSSLVFIDFDVFTVAKVRGKRKGLPQKYFTKLELMKHNKETWQIPHLIRSFLRNREKSENLTLVDISVRVPTGLSPVILSDHPSDMSVISHAGCFDTLRKEIVSEMLK